MIRHWIKAGAAGVLSRTGLDKLMGSLAGSRNLPVVVGYHRVVEDFAVSAKASIPSLLVSGRTLELHLDWIGRRHRFVDLDELGKRLESGQPLRERIAAVTFDDGYDDFYEHALPILKKKGIPAALFPVTGLLGTSAMQAHDKLYLLLARRAGRRVRKSWKEIALPDIDDLTPYQATRILLQSLPFAALQQVIQALEAEDTIPEATFAAFRSLTWEKIGRIHRAGFTIGSHTRSHIVMTNESTSRISEELAESREELGSRLGTNILHFSYPGSFFNNTCVNEVAAAGYRFGYTGCTHRSAEYPLLTVPRTVLWERSSLDSNEAFSGSILNCQIHHAFALVGGCRQRHEVTK